MLPKGASLNDPGATLNTVLFPESGMISIVNRTPTGRRMEVGVFGREGMGSTAVILGGGSAPFAVFTQVAGHGYMLDAAVLQQAIGESATLRGLLLRYCQAFLIQVAQTAVSNGTFTIEQRLARWLLLVHDRIDGDEMPVTHELLSVMLGVRRTGVTLAIHVLEGEKTIRARRGMITVLHRDKLLAIASEGYGVAEAEYERLIGPMGRC